MKSFIALLVWLLTAGGAFAGTQTYNYDSAGRVVNINYGGNTNTTYTYDNVGNLLNRATFVSANPDLGLSQSATPAPASAGVSLQFSLVVVNNSPGSASGVVVTNNLPGNASFLAATATQGSVAQNGNVLSWTVGTLAGGVGATLNFQVRSPTAGALTNSAMVSAALPDPNPGNNSTTLVVTVLPPPDLAASISGPNLLLSWPIAGAGGFSLQHADSLTPPVTWVPDPAAPAIFGSLFYSSEPLTNALRFFRLSSPP